MSTRTITVITKRLSVFTRLHQRLRQCRHDRRIRQVEGKPVQSLDSVLGPFTSTFQSRVLIPLATLKDQYLEGQRYLVPNDWQVCREKIEEAVRTARELAKEIPLPPTSDHPDPVESYLAAQVNKTAAEIKSRAQRRVQREYFKGIVFGVFASVALLAGLYGIILAIFNLFLDGLHGGNKTLVEHALVAIGGGAGGATLSSLIRLRKQEIEDYHASGLRAATIRIMLGWFFAAAVLFLVKGQVINIFNEPGAPVAIWFYWGGIGFLSGFNEAWVTDLVTKKSGDAAKNTAKNTVDEVKAK